jgi:hypothetical protein
VLAVDVELGGDLGFVDEPGALPDAVEDVGDRLRGGAAGPAAAAGAFGGRLVGRGLEGEHLR